VTGSNSRSLGVLVSCSGLHADGFSELDGHADDGLLPQFAYAASWGGGVTLS